jgi:hypothetical protein
MGTTLRGDQIQNYSVEEIKAAAVLCRYCGTNQSEFEFEASITSDETSPTQADGHSGGEKNILSSVAAIAGKSSWVVAGGGLAWLVFGFRPDGIYGPWQPVGVFAAGTFVIALTMLIGVSVAISPKRPKTQMLRSWGVGFVAWAKVSLFTFLLAYSISMNQYGATQSVPETRLGTIEVPKAEPKGRKKPSTI